MFWPNASIVYWGCGSQMRLSIFRYSPVKWCVVEWLCPDPLFLESYNRSSVCRDFLCNFTGRTHLNSVIPFCRSTSGSKKFEDSSVIWPSPEQSGNGGKHRDLFIDPKSWILTARLIIWTILIGHWRTDHPGPIRGTNYYGRILLYDKVVKWFYGGPLSHSKINFSKTSSPRVLHYAHAWEHWISDMVIPRDYKCLCIWLR